MSNLGCQSKVSFKHGVNLHKGVFFTLSQKCPELPIHYSYVTMSCFYSILLKSFLCSVKACGPALICEDVWICGCWCLSLLLRKELECAIRGGDLAHGVRASLVEASRRRGSVVDVDAGVWPFDWRRAWGCAEESCKAGEKEKGEIHEQVLGNGMLWFYCYLVNTYAQEYMFSFTSFSTLY